CGGPRPPRVGDVAGRGAHATRGAPRFLRGMSPGTRRPARGYGAAGNVDGRSESATAIATTATERDCEGASCACDRLRTGVAVQLVGSFGMDGGGGDADGGRPTAA